MDEVTGEFIQRLSEQNLGRAIRLSHQFLDGTDGKECGFVPNDFNGETVVVNGQWWR